MLSSSIYEILGVGTTGGGENAEGYMEWLSSSHQPCMDLSLSR